MTVRSFAGMFLALFVAASWLPAQEKAPPDARVTAVESFINDDTSIIVHLNLRKLDLKTAADRFAALAPEDAAEQVKQAKAMVNVIEFARSSLIESGAGDLYVMVDVKDGNEPVPYLLIPVEAGKEPAAVAETLKTMPGVDEEPIIHKGNVVYGGPGTKEHVEGIKASDAARFHHAFQYGGPTDLQIVIAPGKSVTDNPPAEAPPEAAELMKNLRGYVATANLPPKPALAFYLLMKDEASATKAGELIKEGLQGDQVKQMSMAFPVIGKLLDLFTMKQDGDKLKVVLTESNGGIAKLQALLKEAAEEAKKAAAAGLLPNFGPGGPPPGFPPPGFPPPGTPLPGRGAADPFGK